MTEKTSSEYELDRMFDDGVDMTPYIEDETAKFPGLDENLKRVNVNFPVWMVDELD